MNENDGRLPDVHGNPGRWIIGVEIFRQLYSAVGFEWLVWPTHLHGVSHALNFGDLLFAKHCLRLTGRCTKETWELN